MSHTSRLVACVLFALVGCRPPNGPASDAPPLTDDAYPWELRPAAALGVNVQWQQSLVAHMGGRRQGFDVVLVKQGDALTLVGLTPFGTKAFVLKEVGTAVSFESYVDRKLPFPPRLMLIDVQRTWFPVAPRSEVDGAVTTVVGGERVVEQWGGGRLVRRTFERLDAMPPGRIVIDYAEWDDSGMPRRATVDNAWFGYRMIVRTTSVTPL